MAYIIIISCMGIQLLPRLPPPPLLLARLRPACIEYTGVSINPKSIKAAPATTEDSPWNNTAAQDGALELIFLQTAQKKLLELLVNKYKRCSYRRSAGGEPPESDSLNKSLDPPLKLCQD